MLVDVLKSSVGITAVAVAAMLLAGCGGRSGTAKVKPGTIGTLKWEIYDTKTSKMIAKGDRDLHLADVQIKRQGKVVHKTIKLGGHFTFSLAGDPSLFALVGDRDDQHTMSWETFDIDSGHATKQQESGELLYETRNTQNGPEISRLEFLSDVSIRIAPKKDPLHPSWRIKVLQGSVIVWPTLVKDKVVPM